MRRALVVTLLVSSLSASASSQDWRRAVVDDINAGAARYGQMSRDIWEAAEVGYKETRSSALLRDELKASGFRIEEGVAGMPTAFVATMSRMV